MTVSFMPLKTSDFPLLLRWLNTSHVKSWWDKDIHWTMALITEKYENYVHGYKAIQHGNNIFQKSIHAFIICLDTLPIGYIQYYHQHDFPSQKIFELPKSCAELDWYIGEPEFIGKGIGTKVLNLFIEQHIFKFNQLSSINDPSGLQVTDCYFNEIYEAILVSVNTDNISAIRVYEKAGFQCIKKSNEHNLEWMIKKQTLNSYLIQLEIFLLSPNIRHSAQQLEKLIMDDFIEFGSSGNIYNKQDILKALPAENTRYFSVKNFEIKLLSKEVVLITYVTMESEKDCLRSSIWQLKNGGWRMIFHQGTKISN